jgi:GcrA cell cycle regulator
VTDISEELYAKFMQGMTTTEIGKQYGMTKNAVIGRIDRLRRKIAAGKCKEPAMTSTNCTIMELTPKSCRYILDADNTYCGAQRVKGAYCAEHARLCYRPSTLRDDEIAIGNTLRARKLYRIPVVHRSASHG